MRPASKPTPLISVVARMEVPVTSEVLVEASTPLTRTDADPDGSTFAAISLGDLID